jgi:hypothetical protein
MYNRGWVIAGIIAFIALAAFPVYWYAVTPHTPFPELELPTKEKQCIESLEYMRTNHMRLLDAWRIAVVRDNLFIYTASNGKQFQMNLHRTCMGCHTSRERFCKRCHDYNGVTLPCWDCHVAPNVPDKAQDQKPEGMKQTSEINARSHPVQMSQGPRNTPGFGDGKARAGIGIPGRGYGLRKGGTS